MLVISEFSICQQVKFSPDSRTYHEPEGSTLPPLPRIIAELNKTFHLLYLICFLFAFANRDSRNVFDLLIGKNKR